jgi:hypothetical protein
LDPEKYSIDVRMEHVHLIPHMRGVMMVREMKTKARFAKLRGVLHLGGFRSVRREVKDPVPDAGGEGSGWTERAAVPPERICALSEDGRPLTTLGPLLLDTKRVPVVPH